MKASFTLIFAAVSAVALSHGASAAAKTCADVLDIYRAVGTQDCDAIAEGCKAAAAARGGYSRVSCKGTASATCYAGSSADKDGPDVDNCITGADGKYETATAICCLFTKSSGTDSSQTDNPDTEEPTTTKPTTRRPTTGQPADDSTEEPTTSADDASTNPTTATATVKSDPTTKAAASTTAASTTKPASAGADTAKSGSIAAAVPSSAVVMVALAASLVARL